MKTQPEKRNTQQGYILVVALISMLFVGAVFVASTNRSGTEERVATSQLHAASLESAIYAGMYRVEKVSEKASNEENQTKAKMLCLDVETGINALPKKQEFQAATDQEAGIFWEVSSVEAECDLEVPKVYFGMVAWQGDEGKPISRLVGKGKIFIKDTGGSGSGSGSGSGVLGGLSAALGNNATTSSGEIKLLGSGKIEGNAVGNKINIEGGGSSIKGNLAYQDISVQDYLKERSWYKNSDKTLLEEAIAVDPLELEKAVNESYYTDNNNKKTPLLELPETHLKTAFGNLFKGSNVEMGQSPFQKASITPEIFEVYNAEWDVKDYQEVDIPIYSPVSFLGEDIDLRVLKDFKIKNGGPRPSLTVSGGRVILFIDGDVDFRGGTSIKIDDDSSLTLIVTGTTSIGSGFQFPNGKPTNNSGEPSFTLLSTNKTPASAVIISGNSKFYGVVYSISDVKVIESGGIEGQVFGNNITVSGNSKISFQANEFGDVHIPPSDGASGESKFSPELDSDFEINY